MLPSLSELEPLKVYIFAHDKQRRGFDVLVEVAPNRFTQAVLTVTDHYEAIPKQDA